MGSIIRKKEGFSGQKAIIIPKKILAKQCEQNKTIESLYITDIGYYPKAKFHYRERRHGADQNIFIYCAEGKGSVNIDMKTYDMKADDFIFIPIHTAHKYSANEEDPWTIYWVHFKGITAETIVRLARQKHNGPKGFAHYNEERVDLFLNIYRQLERGYSGDNLTYANMTLWYFFTTFIFDERYSSANKFLATDIIDQSISFMGRNIDHILTLEEIAQSASLSVSHFSLLFKKRTGFSPIEYFNHLKIQKACQYLLFTDLRVKEVAFKLGIEDPYYFSRLFTKIMSVSPHEYREEKRIGTEKL